MAIQQPETSNSRTGLKRRLGRGLGSLISAPVQVEPPPSQVNREPGNASATRAMLMATTGQQTSLPIGNVKPNSNQPRQSFDESTLQTLASSIKNSGMMQPIVVRPGQTGEYQIIAGERRWRAAQIAGLDRIDVVIRDVDDRTAAQFSLVENLQREDLNPIERAEAFQRLVNDFGLTHQEIAESVGLDRTSITNHLRLLELDDDIKAALRDGRLSPGHAKALLAFTNNERRRAVAMQAAKDGWSVRETERRVKAMIEASAGRTSAKPRGAAMPAHMIDLEKRLSDHLGTKVHIQTGREKNSGRLIIEFYSLDQFEGLLERLQFEME
jgi:ParB family chromosome partitioning protein